MDSRHHCNDCPHWYVTKKGYPSGFYNITFCKKYNEQIYYLAGEENQTPHPCNMCEKQDSYISYINQEVLDVKRVTERLTEDFYDDMQKITRLCVKSDNIDLNCGADDFQYVIDRLAEYEIAEEEGRLVAFPCKVGDTVWVITHPFNVFDDFDFYEDAHDEIYESYVSSITLYENSNQYRIYAKETRQFIKAYFRECDFGKSIFLNREEAESALREMERT